MIEIKALASGSKGNAYFVTDGVTPVLLECGIGWKDIQRGLNFRTSELAGCLISHEHQDHCKAAKDVLKAGVDCYMSAGTSEAIDVHSHRVKIIKSKEQFVLNSWIILPFDVQHDAQEPLGFLLANTAGEKLLYATDTYYLRYKFQGLTHVMLECNYSADILRENVADGTVPAEMKKRILRSHMSLETCKGFLRANDLSKVEVIYLLHMSNQNSDAERFKREIQELTGKMVFIA